MSAHAERKSFVVSVTLTELMFLLFFLLLLAAVYRLVHLERDLERAQADGDKSMGQATELRRRIEAAKTALGPARALSDEEFIELVGSAVVPSDEPVRSQLRNLKRDLTVLQGELQAERQAHEATAKRAEGLQGEVDALRAADPDGALANLAACESLTSNLRGQVMNCQTRLGRGGMDHPPCWADPKTGKIEFLLETTMDDDGISAVAAWPAHRAASAGALPAVRALLGAKHSPQDFSAAGQPLLEWSKSQDPECRHYVRIVDHTTSVELHKRARFAIESVFYKYEVR